MRTELGKVRRRIISFYVLLLASVVCLPNNLFAAVAASPGEKKADLRVSYEDRLRFYLDDKSRDFLVDMAAREKLLLQMIQNITLEIKSRGRTVVADDQASFRPLYDDLEQKITEYSQEVDNVMKLLTEIIDLEKLMEKEQRYAMADQFTILKDSLILVLDNRDLYKKMPGTRGHVSNLIQEYNTEVDSLLAFYARLSNIERKANRFEDPAVLVQVAEQKRIIAGYLERSQNPAEDSTASTLVVDYVQEAKKLINLVGKLNDLQKKAISENPEFISEVEVSKREILSKMDDRLLKVLGYDDFSRIKGPTVSEIFHEWRSNRQAQYEVKYAEYHVMKKSLVETANERQRSRMLERDVSDAMLNYAENQFLLADIQFDRILDDYGSYFSQFGAVYFYQAESKYARLLYEQAYNAYSEALVKFPQTEYRNDIYLRTLTIAQSLGWRDKFNQRYEEFLGFAQEVNEKQRNRLYFLAGYYGLQVKDTKAAEAALASIEKGSKYYYPGLYLMGLTLASRGQYEGAIRIFKSIVSTESLPWTDPNLAIIRNNALLKLGFIYYNRGDFSEAMKYFASVSRGVENRDQVLIGMAWASMKESNYDASVTYVNDLFQNYLSSDYTYEALVLAAHCKRLLNQPDDALRNLRYVANARGVLDLSNEYNNERQSILQQLDELDRMEKTVLDHQDRNLYNLISEIKYAVQQRLLSLGQTSGVGAGILQEFDSERQEIYRQIRELDSIIESARKSGVANVLADAKTRRDRLVQALSTYQADKEIKNVNYFIDYPLATRESSTRYRQQVVRDMFREMEAEKQRIRDALGTAKSLAEKNGDDVRQKVDLVALEQDLRDLQNRMDRFQTWLSNYQIDDINTDFDRWADFSGFGMSDITTQELQRREQTISSYSENLASIDELMRKRRKKLEERLTQFDSEMEKIREELEAEQLRLKKLEHQKIFDNLYFDATTSEWLQTESRMKSVSDMP